MYLLQKRYLEEVSDLKEHLGNIKNHNINILETMQAIFAFNCSAALPNLNPWWC